MSKQSAILLLRWATGTFLVAMLLPVLGCGGGTGTVTGTVSYKDKPLPGGYITFVPEQGGGAFHGKIEKDGKYRVEQIPVGKVKIGVQGLEPPKHAEGMIPPSEIAKMGKGGARPAPNPSSTYVRIPPRYADPDKSGLSHDVTGGSQEHNIPLK